MTYILGIGGYSHDASAALLCDGKLIAAVQEERLTRTKHIGGFPYQSINYCLKFAGISPEDVTAFAFYAKKSNWDRYLWDVIRASLLNIGYTLSHKKGLIYSVGFRGYRSLNFRADYARFLFETGLNKKTFFDYDHHACHAAAAFYSSPYERAVILCVDGGGDGKTTTGWVGDGSIIREIDLGIRPPHSMGLIYTRITKYLGFPSPGDEYKVMGLAAYGKPVYYDSIKKMIKFQEGGYRINLDYFNYQYQYSLSDKFYNTFGPSRKKDEEITEHYANIAASVQKLYEDVLIHLALWLRKKTGIRNLAISGGSALNCKGNGELLLTGEFDSVFVTPGASDIGTSIGAAQYHWHQKMGYPRSFVMKTDDWGPEYSDEEIIEELNRSNIKYKILANPSDSAAELIADGKIVGWFQGRMEFGPRSLGYRSILADPRQRGIKDKINKTIKFREEFRPFAPSILREYVNHYFDIDVDCPFMTLTLSIRPEKQSEIQGIVHVDGTGRLQTVSRKDQPLYHSLISRFYELTGVPVVLNTSFNLAGEPIVCSPYDALRTYVTCGMDALIMGKCLIQK